MNNITSTAYTLGTKSALDLFFPAGRMVTAAYKSGPLQTVRQLGQMATDPTIAHNFTGPVATTTGIVGGMSGGVQAHGSEEHPNEVGEGIARGSVGALGGLAVGAAAGAMAGRRAGKQAQGQQNQQAQANAAAS